MVTETPRGKGASATALAIAAEGPAYLVMEVCWYTGSTVALREVADELDLIRQRGINLLMGEGYGTPGGIFFNVIKQ